MTITKRKKGQKEVRLFTDTQYEILYRNGLSHESDHIPVAYLVQPELQYQWLVTELFIDDPKKAYGLYYLGDAQPQLGYFDLDTIYKLNDNNKIFNNLAFSTQDRISLFKMLADEFGYIITREEGFSLRFKQLRELLY